MHPGSMKPDEDEAERVLANGLADAWPVLSQPDRLEAFQSMSRPEAEDFFLSRRAQDQYLLLHSVPPAERRTWMRLLAPDDAADLVQYADADERGVLLELLDEPTRKEVSALLAYEEDVAGGLMSPRYARVRPTVTVDEAISYLRKQARERLETLYYAYVIDPDQKLVGVVSFRDLFAAPGAKLVTEVMQKTADIVTVKPET